MELREEERREDPRLLRLEEDPGKQRQHLPEQPVAPQLEGHSSVKPDGQVMSMFRQLFPSRTTLQRNAPWHSWNVEDDVRLLTREEKDE